MSSRNKGKIPPKPVSAPPVLAAPLAAAAWISLAWAGGIIIVYWNSFPWLGQLPGFPALAAAPTRWSVFVADAKALILLATLLPGLAAFGSYLSRLFRLRWFSPLEEIVFSLGLGTAATGYLVLLLGLLQLYRPTIFWGLWAAGLALAWRRWIAGKDYDAFTRWIDRLNRWHAQHKSWWPQWSLLGVIIGFDCLMTFVPEIFYDSMAYHLGVPRWYVFEGGIRYYPSVTAQFPFLRQMLNVLALGLEGERLAKLLHWSSAPLIIATYHVLAQRYSSPKTALIAALAFFSMPMVNMNLWTAGMDIGLASFALLGFLAWLNGMNDSEQRARWLCLAGLFAGFCFASKYPGAFVIAMMCLATLAWFVFEEKDWRRGIGWSFAIGVIASLTAAPWLIKNWVLTGNPVYPYLYSIFGGRDLTLERLLIFTSDTGSGAKRQLLDLLKTPWTRTLGELSSFTSPGVFLLGFSGFLLTGLLPGGSRKKWYVYGFVFFALYWFAINAMTDRIRMAIPGLAVGCFLLGHQAAFYYERSGGVFRWLLAVTVGVSAFIGAHSTLPTLYGSYNPWNVLAGRESADDYRSYTHSAMTPYPATHMFVYAKGLVPPGHRLLIVGDEKVSSSPVPFLATGVFNTSLIVQWAQEAKTVQELVHLFKRNKVSHLLVNVPEALRLSGYKILPWDPRAMGLFADFSERHLRLVQKDEIPAFSRWKTLPIMLYEFVEQPGTIPPSANILLELFEEVSVPSEDGQVPSATTSMADARRNLSGWAQKRRELLESVDKAYPGVMTVQQKIQYWRSQERG